MMRPTLTMLFALTLIVPTAVLAQAPPADLCGRYVKDDGFRTLYLWGTPRQRGYAQGWLLAEVIVENFDADIEKLMQRVRKDQYENRLLKIVVPRFAFSEDEEAELQGMFAGIQARLPAAKRRLSFLEREITLMDLKAANTVGDWMALGCSSYAIDGSRTPDGSPAAGRNFDFPAFKMVLDDQHVVVHAPQGDAIGWAGVSYPGCVGVMTAMNTDGVFISIHDVRIFPTPITAVRRNVPRLCAMRRVMRDVAAEGALEAVHERLKRWPTLYGNNFMVVTPKFAEGASFAAVFEYDNRRHRADGVQRRDVDHVGAKRAPHLLCTNHHRVRKPKREDPADLCGRYNRLHAAVEGRKPGTVLSVPQMFETLSVAAYPRGDAPQRPYRHGTTHQAVAFTGSKELHVKLGAVGKNIRQVKSRRIPVLEATAAAKPEPVSAPGASGGGNDRR